MLFPLGIIPFTYVFSFLFNSENVAQTIIIFLNFVIAGIGAISVYFLRLLPDTKDTGDMLHNMFKALPTYCLTGSLMFVSGKDRLSVSRRDLPTENLAMENMGADIRALIIHFVVWTIMLILIEAGLFSKCRGMGGIGKKVAKTEQVDVDDDVAAESKRVHETSPNEMKVRVKDFRKIYSTSKGCCNCLSPVPLVAVENVSFGLDYGECFALLGINGAGKTSTFKSLTNEIIPTEGELTINGMDIRKQFGEVRKMIGYCP